MTIKETAGKVLLYFYQLQRVTPLSMRHRQLGFITKKDGGVSLTSDKKWFTSNLQGINPSATDIFNAFLFLTDKGFIQSSERATAAATVHVGIKLTETGIDMVEGIERGDEGKQDFYVAFNMQVDSSTDLTSFINDTLGISVE